MKVATLANELGDVVGVAVVLTEWDRRNIAEMPADATVYCMFRGDVPFERAERWAADVRAGDVVAFGVDPA